jgi:flagellar biosynthesis protein FlhG
LHIVTVASGSVGTGKTTAVINLAAALAGIGKKVLVIDENTSASNLGGTLGISAHRDLLDVIRRDMTLDDVVIPRPEGFGILSAGRGLKVLGKLSPDDEAHLVDAFGHISQPVDVILVDSASGRMSRLLPLIFPQHAITILVSPQPVSITAAYALIKHISGSSDHQHFRMIVNKVGIEVEARKIFDNMAAVASRYLAVSLDFLGCIPPDDKLTQSIRRGRSVIEAFPAAASAIAFRRAAEALLSWPCNEDENKGEKSEDRGTLQGFVQCLIQNNRNNQDSPGIHGGRINATAIGRKVNHV